MTTASLDADLNAYFEELAAHLPAFSLTDQETALTIYRELAKGDPVSDAELAQALDLTTVEAHERRTSSALKSLTYLDSEDRIIGFGGLATLPMHHEFLVNGRKLWTWCAWDSLFIPELLGAEARVTSPDPRTKTPVRLTVTTGGVREIDPPTAVVSFIRTHADVFTKSAANVMASFCHYVFFFESQESGEAWASEHADTFLVSMDDALALTRRLNARNFGDALAGL
ncbi:MAG: organomercurial lyase [Gemmatimonadales bacterium]